MYWSNKKLSKRFKEIEERAKQDAAFLNDNTTYICLVDDDGTKKFDDVYNLVQENYPEVKLSISAIISKYVFENPSYLTEEELHAYEDKGVAILCHSTSFDHYTAANADSLARYARSEYNKYGFKTPEIIVYPGGVAGDDADTVYGIVRNYFKYGLNVNVNGNEQIRIPYKLNSSAGTLNLGRLPIPPKDATTSQINYFRTALHQSLDSGPSLLMLMTHAGAANFDLYAFDNWLAQIVQSAHAYAAGTGKRVEFCTVPEALAKIEAGYPTKVARIVADQTAQD